MWKWNLEWSINRAQGGVKGGWQKEFGHKKKFGHFSLTFLMLLSLFCQAPFAGLLLRQGESHVCMGTTLSLPHCRNSCWCKCRTYAILLLHLLLAPPPPPMFASHRAHCILHHIPSNTKLSHTKIFWFCFTTTVNFTCMSLKKSVFPGNFNGPNVMKDTKDKFSGQHFRNNFVSEGKCPPGKKKYLRKKILWTNCFRGHCATINLNYPKETPEN